MVASERDLANTLFFFFSNPQSYQLESFTNQQMNIEINMPRGQSMSSMLWQPLITMTNDHTNE